MGDQRLEDFEEMAGAWDAVSAASKVVECALPRQMSEAIAGLIAARVAMDAAVRRVGLRIARPSLPLTNEDRQDG